MILQHLSKKQKLSLIMFIVLLIIFILYILYTLWKDKQKEQEKIEENRTKKEIITSIKEEEKWKNSLNKL